jgi:predicted dienelactone hydrolase
MKIEIGTLGLLFLLACASQGDEDPADAADTAGVLAAAVDPSGNGSYSVFRQSSTASTVDGSVAITVCAPSLDGGATIATAGSPFPVVVIAPGFQQGRTQYDSYCRHLATWGVFAIARENGGGFAPDHDKIARQTSGVIGWVLASSPWKDRLDGTKIAVAGHSLGGKTSLLAASRDARIKAVVAWDPVDSNTPSVAPEKMPLVTVPVLLLGETLNGSGGFQPCAPSAENYHQFFLASNAPALEVTVIGADHMDWVDNTGCFTCGFCTKGAADHLAVKALTRRSTVAWLLRYLKNDLTMDTYLTGAVMQADVAAGRAVIATK